MENSSYKIISFISNKNGSETTTIIYDTINKRAIEKWTSYQLKRNNSQFIITDRFIYAYNRVGNLSKILEIVKGPDDRMFNYLNDDNEYCHSINRDILYRLNSSGNNTKTEIVYSRNNHLGSRKKKYFQKSLLLELDNNPNRKTRVSSIRLKYLLLRNGKYFSYEYSKENFNDLLRIVEYKIIADLRFVNKIISFLGLPILESIPDLFLKFRVGKNSPKSIYKIDRVKAFKQDYFLFMNEEVLINQVILIEDSFIQAKINLQAEYEAAYSIE